MIVYTCPKCGADLQEVCFPTYPPQYRKECWNCGWKSDTEREEIVRIPYVEEPDNPSITFAYDDKSKTYVPPYCRNCPNHPTNGGSGGCNCILGGNTVICSTEVKY